MSEKLKVTRDRYHLEVAKYDSVKAEIMALEARQGQLEKQLADATVKVETLTTERLAVLDKIVNGEAQPAAADKISSTLADARRKFDDLQELLALTQKTVDAKREALRELDPRGMKATVFAAAAECELEVIRAQLEKVQALARAGMAYTLQERVSELLGNRGQLPGDAWDALELKYLS